MGSWWVDALRGASVFEVAADLGYPCDTSRRGRGIIGCPACAAPTRHTKSSDKRGAVGVRKDGAGWRCFQCNASGDAFDFVAHDRAGCRGRDLDAAGKQRVREWVGANYGPAFSYGHVSPPRPVEPEPDYPPAGEVAALWDACGRVDAHRACAGWMRRRATPLDPTRVADLDLARALPPARHLARLPSWVCVGRDSDWRAQGYDLVIPLVDAHGALKSVRGRKVAHPAGAWGEGPKARAATGFDVVGLCMANGRARQMLERGILDMRPDDDRPHVVICEGEADYLHVASSASDADVNAPAVISLISGSITAELASRIPHGARVLVATDDDPTGDRYAQTVADYLRGRAELYRWRPRQPNTSNTHGQQSP